MNTRLTLEGFERLSERIGELVDRFEAIQDEALRGDIFELLQQVDALHREGLARLLRLVPAGDATLSGLTGDPILRTVLELYDLLPESLAAASADVIPLKEVRPRPRKELAGFIPLEEVRLPANQMQAPVFLAALADAALGEGSLRGVEIEGGRVLLCRIGGEVTAFRNHCPGSVLPLDFGRLEGTTIICPWHDCRFDGRTGRRLDGREGRLEPIPVSVMNGEIRLAVAVAAKQDA